MAAVTKVAQHQNRWGQQGQFPEAAEAPMVRRPRFDQRRSQALARKAAAYSTSTSQSIRNTRKSELVTPAIETRSPVVGRVTGDGVRPVRQRRSR